MKKNGFYLFLYFYVFGRGMRDPSSPTRMEPAPPAVEAWSPNHWNTREVPQNGF